VARPNLGFEDCGMHIQDMKIGRIKLNARNARTHSARQIAQIAKSIRAFGFTNPLLVSEDDELIAGHGRWLAANELGLDRVPVIESHKTRDGIASAWRSRYRNSRGC
jgi:ParB-like chromosome segregation protein Spo0J